MSDADELDKKLKQLAEIEEEELLDELERSSEDEHQ